MATTFSTQAGSTFRVDFEYRNDDDTPIDTTGFTAQFTVTGLHPRTRTLLAVKESNDPSSILFNMGTGHWRLTIPGHITSSLPPTATWELRLISDVAAGDVLVLEDGTLLTEPERVK